MTIKAKDPLIQKLDMIRSKRGMKLYVWAGLAGVSHITVYRARKNPQSVSVEVLRRLADVLGVALPTLEPLD